MKLFTETENEENSRLLVLQYRMNRN